MGFSFLAAELAATVEGTVRFTAMSYVIFNFVSFNIF